MASKPLLSVFFLSSVSLSMPAGGCYVPNWLRSSHCLVKSFSLWVGGKRKSPWDERERERENWQLNVPPDWSLHGVCLRKQKHSVAGEPRALRAQRAPSTLTLLTLEGVFSPLALLIA